MFQRFYDEGLAQAAFLVGCDRTKQAVVIDPRRDASVHVAAARQLGATIVAAIETHVHADFVSGAPDLAAAGARGSGGAGGPARGLPPRRSARPPRRPAERRAGAPPR